MAASYRALWLSDIHLGTSAARAADLLGFLDSVTADTIYLIGDIVDLQRLKLRPQFPPEHRQVIARFFEMAHRGTRIVYVPGNHDVEFRRLAGRNLGGIEVALEASHTCGSGRKFLIVHGDCLDRQVRRGTGLEQFGAAAYQLLVRADARLNRFGNRFGHDCASISSRIKLRLKSANEYIRRYEETAARYAATRGFDGIVCGHIHRPAFRQIDGIWYANDGDWVEHRTALAETGDGQMQILQWSRSTVDVVAAPRQAPLAA
ncbi:MAG TPA: UDP-2,3-diacylglucosamine diphosphatase [Woeseiaceae bacterium]